MVVMPIVYVKNQIFQSSILLPIIMFLVVHFNRMKSYTWYLSKYINENKNFIMIETTTN